MAWRLERLAILAALGLALATVVLAPRHIVAQEPTPSPTATMTLTPYAGPPGWTCGTPAPPPPVSESRWYYGLPLCTPTPRATAVRTPYPTLPRVTIPRATIPVSPATTVTPSPTPTPTLAPAPPVTATFYVYTVFYPPAGQVFRIPAEVAGYGDAVSITTEIEAWHYPGSQALYGVVFSPTMPVSSRPVTVTLCTEVLEWGDPCCSNCEGCVAGCGYAMESRGMLYHRGASGNYKWDHWGTTFWRVPSGDCRLADPVLQKQTECYTVVENTPWGEQFGYGVLHEGWGIRHRVRVRITVLVGTNVIVYPPPGPTPTCIPCRGMVIPERPPIWFEPPEVSEPACYTLLPHIGWSNAPLHIPDFEFGPVEICVRYVTLKGEIFGVDLNALVTAIASLVAIAILVSVLAGV